MTSAQPRVWAGSVIAASAPLDHAAAPGEAGAEGAQQHVGAGPQAAVGGGLASATGSVAAEALPSASMQSTTRSGSSPSRSPRAR